MQHCVQKPNETLRDYIQRWITLHHTVENVSDHQVVCAFKEGVKYRELSLKVGRAGDMSLSRMMEIATNMPMVRKRIGSGVASTSQSPRTLEISVGSKSVKPSQPLLEKPWP